MDMMCLDDTLPICSLKSARRQVIEQIEQFLGFVVHEGDNEYYHFYDHTELSHLHLESDFSYGYFVIYVNNKSFVEKFDVVVNEFTCKIKDLKPFLEVKSYINYINEVK
jgi:hypothetical protein